MSKSKSAEFEHDFVFLRSADSEGRSYNGTFQWPTESGGLVEAPDWNPEPVCGGGLHGLADGLGDRCVLAAPSSQSALWYVCGAIRSEAVSIDDGKIKVPRCGVLYVGDFAGAMKLIAPAMTEGILMKVRERTAAATPEGEVASGYRGAATASGYSGAATASGYSGVALASGLGGRARVSEGCLLVLVERDEKTDKIVHHFAAMCGERGVEPDTWYELVDGELREVTP